MTYDEALAYIHSMRHGGPELAGMRAVLDRLSAPDREYPIVHVAGTNGKGSVCAYVDSVLRAAGYRTGLFTSPFVTRFNERIRVDGMDIPDGDLAEVTERVRSALELTGHSPAEFELVTLLGLTYFAQSRCNAAVLEVGMGGVHDATNVIESSALSIFTNIGLDHTQYLGSTVEEIAGVKSGIIKENGLALAYCDPGGVISRAAAERGAVLRVMDFSTLNVRSAGLDGCVFDFDGLEGLRIPLGGTCQPKNAALAVTACRMLRERGFEITDEHIRRGLASVGWRGRFELISRRPDFIIDGGHNPQAVEAAAESLKRYFPGRRITFLMGVMADKDVRGILERLLPLAESFVCVSPPAPRAMDAGELARLIVSLGGSAVAAGSIGEGVRTAAALAGEDGAVCALGSLYILEDVILFLERKSIQKELYGAL